MKMIDQLKIKKYRYDIFIKPLTFINKIKVLAKKYNSHALGPQAPQSMEIGVTYKCQLSCGHCGVHGREKKNRQEMGIEQIKDLIDQAGRMGIYTVVFSGGEPLTRPDICACLEYAKNQAMITAVSTNGIGLTEGLVARIKKAGINFINISFDSADAYRHDQLRGQKGCFAQAVNAVRLCRKYKIAAIVSTYAAKDNIRNGSLKEIIHLAAKIKATGVRILFSASAGRWFGNKEHFIEEPDYLTVKAMLDPCFVYVEGICNQFAECNAVLKKLIYVSPYGDVQPCSFVPISFGNIKDKNLKDIWQEMQGHSFYSRFKADRCVMCSQRFFDFYDREGSGQGVLAKV